MMLLIVALFTIFTIASGDVSHLLGPSNQYLPPSQHSHHHHHHHQHTENFLTPSSGEGFPSLQQYQSLSNNYLPPSPPSLPQPIPSIEYLPPSTTVHHPPSSNYLPPPPITHQHHHHNSGYQSIQPAHHHHHPSPVYGPPQHQHYQQPIQQQHYHHHPSPVYGPPQHQPAPVYHHQEHHSSYDIQPPTSQYLPPQLPSPVISAPAQDLHHHHHEPPPSHTFEDDGYHYRRPSVQFFT